MNWIELNWIAVNWMWLDLSELNWTEMNWSELNVSGFKWTELHWSKLNLSGFQWIEVQASCCFAVLFKCGYIITYRFTEWFPSTFTLHSDFILICSDVKKGKSVISVVNKSVHMLTFHRIQVIIKHLFLCLQPKCGMA